MKTLREQPVQRATTPDLAEHPAWCTEHDDDAGKHCAEPATVLELDDGDEVITIRLTQLPGEPVVVELETWSWAALGGNLDDDDPKPTATSRSRPPPGRWWCGRCRAACGRRQAVCSGT